MKTALIIGGTGGIGEAISMLFLENDIKTYATYYTNQEKAKEMAQLQANLNILQCDVKKIESVRKTIETIYQKEERIDILVNCITGNLKLKLFESLTLEELSDDINTILLGSINLFKHVIPVMKNQKTGVIVNILTTAIFDFPKRMSSYIAAKAGLFGLMKSLAMELEPFNVRLAGISPYFVNTCLIKAFPEKLLELEKEKIIQPRDIAELVLAISQDIKKYPNGVNLILNTRKEALEMLS